jgi:hypothetical protein
VRRLTTLCLGLVVVACDRDRTTATIRAPADPPAPASTSAWSPPAPTPRPPPPEFAMVAIAEGDPFGAAALPAGASIETDVVPTSRFARFPLAAGDTARTACVTLLKWAAGVAMLPVGKAMVCGEDRHAPLGRAVRTWMIDPVPLLSRADVLRAEIRYDEDVSPLHGHVVCELDPRAVKRWNAWAKAHPKVRIALEVGTDVIDVDDIGPAVMTGGELWITPKTPFGVMASNDAETKALAAAMSGDAGP